MAIDRTRRRIVHVDMDAFFVAVERQRHPELTGRPVIVGGRGNPYERGVVATASYEARRFGVYSGMPLRLAHRRCPQAVFVAVDYAAYSAVAARIKHILASFAPEMEDAGIDEAFLDISACAGSPVEIGRAIKQRLREKTGLSCSVGIGPNKRLAKLASDLEKPDGLVVLNRDDIRQRVWPLPVRKLWGVGPKTEQRLAALGLTTIGDVAHEPVEILTAHLGEVHGRHLHQAAHGIDDSPLITHWVPKSLGREVTFQRDIDDVAQVGKTLAALTRLTVAQLRQRGYTTRHVTVKLRSANFHTHTHAVPLAFATNEPEPIVRAMFECLQRFALPDRVRLVGVRLGGLARRPTAEKSIGA